MLKRLALAIGLALALAVPAHADPQKFATEESATKFCKAGNVVWYNPDSKIYFAPGSQFYVVHVLEVTPPKEQPYADARGDIAGKLISQKLTDAIRDYASKLRKAHDVKTFISRIDS